jgi:hypothetical protein
MRKLKIGLAALVLCISGTVAAQERGDWLVAPYLWAADTSWDIASRGSGSVTFSNLVDKLDGAGLIRVEYVRNKIGFTFDYVGMSLSDNTRISTPGPLPVDIAIRANVDLTVFEAGAFYRPSATDQGIDVLAGVRDFDVDSTLLLTPVGLPTERFDTGKGFTDIYVGARYLHRLSETWDFSVRGDYGFGGSDGALNLIASVGWRSRGNFGMSFAYRHLAFDVDQRVDGEPATSEYSFSGPAVGFMFRF